MFKINTETDMMLIRYFAVVGNDEIEIKYIIQRGNINER